MYDLRIDIRHQVRKDEALEHEMCKEKGVEYVPKKARNGETWPQIMVRTKRALMMPENKWNVIQRQRMEILFERYPDLEQAYIVMQKLRCIFNEKN